MRLFTLLAFLIVLVSATTSIAQTAWPSPEVEKMYQQARTAMSRGQLREAVPVFRQVVDLAPDVPEARRDLANAYQLAGSNKEALDVLEPLFKANTADEQAYRIGAVAQSALKEPQKARRLLRKGLDQYPNAGLLYKEMGTLYEQEGNKEDALGAWLDGIEHNPDYHVNYYEAAHSYIYSRKLVWAILYAEIFINIERQTPRANEARKMLLAAYKRFFFPSPTDIAAKIPPIPDNPKTFEDAVAFTLKKNLAAVADGISTENLTMLRVRFIADWNDTFAAQYPYALFIYQDKMLRDGLFDAYNQFVFGRTDDAGQYDAWIRFHPEAMPKLETWTTTHKLVPSAGGFYNSKQTKNLFPAKKTD